MANATVIGKFLYATTGTTCTIMKFSPSHIPEGEEIYITDGLEYVYPLENSNSFVTDDGSVLLAEH